MLLAHRQTSPYIAARWEVAAKVKGYGEIEEKQISDGEARIGESENIE